MEPIDEERREFDVFPGNEGEIGELAEKAKEEEEDGGEVEILVCRAKVE